MALKIAETMRDYSRLLTPQEQSPAFRPGSETVGEFIKDEVKGAGKTAQIFAGAGAAPVVAANAVADLAGGADKEAMRDFKAVRQATPYTQAGGIAGDVGMFAGLLPTRAAAAGATVLAGKAPAWLGSRAGMVADTAGTSAATVGATTPGSAQERVGEALLAGGLTAGPTSAYAIPAGLRRIFGSRGQALNTAEGVLHEVGDAGAEKLISGLKGADPGAGIGVLTSAAAKSENPTLQVLESGLRAKRPDLFTAGDRENARARWDALVGAAGSKEELVGLKGARDAKTGAMREEALADAQLTTAFSQSEDVTEPMLKGLREKVADWRQGNLRPNKDVQALADYLDNEFKQGVTPAQLYEVRKMLTDGIQAGTSDQLKNAVKAARTQRVETVQSIDEVLNTLSGGGWGDYMKTYARESGPITSKKAMNDIVDALERGMPAGVVPPVMGQQPGWKTVGTLRDRFGEKEFGSKTFDRLLPEDRATVDMVVDSLKRQADTMGAKATLGSPTAPLLASMGRVGGLTRGVIEGGAAAKVPFGNVLASSVLDKTGRAAEEELARVMRDPSAMAKLLEDAIRARKISAGASRAGAGLGAGYE